MRTKDINRREAVVIKFKRGVDRTPTEMVNDYLDARIDDRTPAEVLRDHIESCIDEAFEEWTEGITLYEAYSVCLSREFFYQSIMEKVDDCLHGLATEKGITEEWSK